MSAAPMPLSFEQIDCYARRFGFDDESFDDLFYLLSRLDALYIEDYNAQAKKRDKKDTKEK